MKGEKGWDEHGALVPPGWPCCADKGRSGTSSAKTQCSFRSESERESEREREERSKVRAF